MPNDNLKGTGEEGDPNLDPYKDFIESLDFGDLPRSAESVSLKDVETGDYIAVTLSDGAELYFRVAGASDIDNSFEDRQIIAETLGPQSTLYRVRIDGGVSKGKSITLRILDQDDEGVVRSVETANVVKIAIGSLESFENKAKEEALKPVSIVNPVERPETYPGERGAAEDLKYLITYVTDLAVLDEDSILPLVVTALENVVCFVGGKALTSDLTALIRDKMELLRADELVMIMSWTNVEANEKDRRPDFGVTTIPIPGSPGISLKIDVKRSSDLRGLFGFPDIHLIKTDGQDTSNDEKYRECCTRLNLILPADYRSGA